ncbi:hypothetical protein HG536_0E02760 [Torulaspora globosa]|uniref:FYVE-type domain-containing protein n=1 Tax=Torulaspora globosa TaxID=48254 RepID=A0A7G3ZIM9_9SACH|nr:uncharacterized protein HG536_0E02760 [Torulaspora globosa]QLL33365.1 hypothetical protein HG536_0E02760 [Torulaspora globosa]
MMTSERRSETASEVQGEVTEKLSCPICFQAFGKLGPLNDHLDKDHGFGGPEVKAGGNSNGRASRKQHKRERGPKSHHRALEIGLSQCNECHQRLKRGEEAQNCMKCGELFCKKHCQNVMKLDGKGQYEPTQGKWRICCYKCYSERPGYNDYGAVKDLTNSFQKLRNLKSEDKQLQILHLENRLVRLIDGIAFILRSHEESLWGNLTTNSEVARYERTVTSWRQDKEASNCYVCNQPFGIMLRKHHCRLCGNVVCDNETANCSNRIPISNLVNAADDIPFTEPRSDLLKRTISVRICSRCTHSLYFGRKFKKDQAKPLSPLLSQCEKIHNVSRSILNLLSLLTASLEEIERLRSSEQTQYQASIDESARLRAKLFRTIASYTQLAKSIATLLPRNTAERKIQQSIRMASSIFINEKLVHMKSLPVPSSDADQPHLQADQVAKPFKLVYNNLSIKEVKRFREELMVLKEQRFLVESMIENCKKQRNFDEITILSSNLQELDSRIAAIQLGLGDQGFV